MTTAEEIQHTKDLLDIKLKALKDKQGKKKEIPPVPKVKFPDVFKLSKPTWVSEVINELVNKLKKNDSTEGVTEDKKCIRVDSKGDNTYVGESAQGADENGNWDVQKVYTVDGITYVEWAKGSWKERKDLDYS